MSTQPKFTILAVVACLGLAASSTQAALILAYDSLLPGSGGSATALSVINSVTDGVLVASAAPNSTLGARGVLNSINTSQFRVQGPYGDQGDMQFRFGNSNTVAGEGTLPGSLSVAHMSLGPYIEFSYTAAANQTLDELTVDLWGNSANGSFYGARDSGLYVQVAGGGFSQFGGLDLNGGSGDLGIVSFTDSFAVAAGDLVEIRLAFTDRTRVANDAQASTRIGNVQIFATIPEPSRALLLGIGALGFLARRRR